MGRYSDGSVRGQPRAAQQALLLEHRIGHLDTIRDLKQINSLLASMAYPVLEDHGLLRGSRLTAG